MIDFSYSVNYLKREPFVLTIEKALMEYQNDHFTQGYRRSWTCFLSINIFTIAGRSRATSVPDTTINQSTVLRAHQTLVGMWATGNDDQDFENFSF